MKRLAVGVLASTVAVAVVTAAIELFKPYVPVLSLGVLYVFAVLPIAVVYGLGLAIVVSVASMLAFNWFHLPPVHTFTLADSENWFALAVYLATAVVVSELAARARRRAVAAEQRERESALLAELATDLLSGRDLEEEIGEIGSRTARVLGTASAEIELGEPHRPPARSSPFPLGVDGRTVGTLYTPEGSDPNVAVQHRFLPALAALLAVAVDRSRLEREALEAEALRRSDLVKTALLRAVSHDLRSPLTGISTAIGALRNATLHLSDADRDELLETIELDCRPPRADSSATCSTCRVSRPVARRPSRSCGRSTISPAKRPSRSARASVSTSSAKPRSSTSTARRCSACSRT